MIDIIFKYTRSLREDAIKTASVSLMGVVISYFCLKLLPNIQPNEFLLIYGVIAAIFVGMWVFLVIPNLLKTGVLICSVDNKKIQLTLPCGESYTVSIDDIKHIEKIRTIAVNQYVEYWIISKSSEDQLIPAIHGLSPEKVLKALKKVRPGLEIKKKTNS